MRRFLALDIGLKRTGVSYTDEQTQVPIPLKTLCHASLKELSAQILDLIKERNVTDMVVGLPLLPSGEEGEQASIVRQFTENIPLPESVNVSMLDERYTTPRIRESDPDSAAACALLGVFMRREKI